MSDVSPILSLPLIQPSQAQKHVTHNEALRVLDVLVQPVVATRGGDVAPASPAEGDRHIVGAVPTGAWAGRAGWIAVREAGQWEFLEPQEGWRAMVLAEGAEVTFLGGLWRGAAERDLRVSALGVNAGPDAFNRLTVAGAATLLTHAGSGGHQLKMNKTGAGDTASLLFQTGFSGRAEMGTTGTDDFTVKVSADGAVFRDALRVAAATGVAALPQGATLPDGSPGAPALSFADDADTGLARTAANQMALVAGGAARAVLSATALQVDVALTGTAITQSQTDTTAGRVLKVGDFGLGVVSNPVMVTDLNLATTNGLYALPNTGVTNTPDGWTTGQGVLMVTTSSNGNNVVQVLGRVINADRWTRSRSGTVWGAWHRMFHAGNVLGTVSQSAGVPTGRLIETAANANGIYRRFACGMQVCWRTNLSGANANTALGALFRSADVTWTYPAAFAAGSGVVVTGDADDPDVWVTATTPGETSVALRLVAGVTKGAAIAFRAMAVGRWFV